VVTLSDGQASQSQPPPLRRPQAVIGFTLSRIYQMRNR
jgi:hypothetical protein